jgi:hypothetical protein
MNSFVYLSAEITLTRCASKHNFILFTRIKFSMLRSVLFLIFMAAIGLLWGRREFVYVPQD